MVAMEAQRVASTRLANVEKLRAQFRRLDRDGDGSLDFDEISSLLRRGDASMSLADVKALFNAIDTDASGRIEFDEFVAYVHSGKSNRRKQAAKPSSASSPALLVESATPGPGEYDVRTASKSAAPHHFVAPLERGGSRRNSNASDNPGPGAYEIATAARHRSADARPPVPTIGTAARDSVERTTCPGPMDYDVRDVQKHTAAANMGGARGRPDLAKRNIPGPTDYEVASAAEYKASMRRGSAATMGRSQRTSFSPSGHRPGPGEYSSERKDAHVPGGNYFGIRRNSGQQDGALRRQFRKLDENRDGTLDVQEVAGLLRKGDASFTEEQVQMLFSAIDVDQNGRIDFDELLYFVNSDGRPRTTGGNSRVNQRLKQELQIRLGAVAPGPGDYDTIKARRYRVPGGGFGRAARDTS